jgi:3',5'-nucleoside bisphosphate phosphatase
VAGSAPIGRPHIAQAMVEAGYVTSIDEAFDRYLADGGPACVVKHALPPEEGVRLIRDAGGAAVLAHPGLREPYHGETPSLIDRLTAVGLAGVEAEHAGHDAASVEYWRTAAAERGLLVTGSSDFHGARKEARLGQATTSVVVVDALRERADAAFAAGGSQSW